MRSGRAGRAEVLEYVIDKLAFMLEQHMTLVADVEAHASKLDAGGGSRSDLSRSIENLRALRESISQIVDVISENIGSAPTAFLDDAFALIGYYVEAGARSEERALRHASKYVDVRHDIASLEELVARARILLSNINMSFKA